MKLSVVITTKNEQANIGNCISSFDPFRDQVEVIVVDNRSTDKTKEIAAELGAKVYDRGPERCAQRNFGWQMANCGWVLILDADMIVPRETVSAIFAAIDDPDARADAYWISEIRSGDTLRVRARNFERSFYDGTPIDALRLFKVSVLESVGGYDEALMAGGEDWELDIRVLQLGARCEVISNAIIHNETSISLWRMLRKKAYYSKTMGEYRKKWAGHPAISKQFGFYYRFIGVFVENGKWKRLLRHPILASVMYFERIAVGFVYLCARCRSARQGKLQC